MEHPLVWWMFSNQCKSYWLVVILMRSFLYFVVLLFKKKKSFLDGWKSPPELHQCSISRDVRNFVGFGTMYESN